MAEVFERQKILFDSYMKTHGLKITSERSAILDAITTFRVHFDADELCERLRERGDDISRATVYRSLPLFIRTGIIKETVGSHERTCYENAFGQDHHDHLVCSGCGKLIEFRDERIERLQNEVCKRNRFIAVDHFMSITGYCDRCAGKRARDSMLPERSVSRT